jgi:hypothetical protein
MGSYLDVSQMEAFSLTHSVLLAADEEVLQPLRSENLAVMQAHWQYIELLLLELLLESANLWADSA